MIYQDISLVLLIKKNVAALEHMEGRIFLPWRNTGTDIVLQMTVVNLGVELQEEYNMHE